jgi:hypothetical protein
VTRRQTASTFAPDRYELAIEAIHRLITERGIGWHALFHEVGEGEAFPDGSESMSGGVFDEHGRTYSFWTGWDTDQGRAVFTTWERFEPEPRLLESREYREARAAVGLAPASSR